MTPDQLRDLVEQQFGMSTRRAAAARGFLLAAGETDTWWLVGRVNVGINEVEVGSLAAEETPDLEGEIVLGVANLPAETSPGGLDEFSVTSAVDWSWFVEDNGLQTADIGFQCPLDATSFAARHCPVRLCQNTLPCPQHQQRLP